MVSSFFGKRTHNPEETKPLKFELETLGLQTTTTLPTTDERSPNWHDGSQRDGSRPEDGSQHDGSRPEDGS